MFSDFKFATRQLVKSPGFTAIAILTLALGIGLNTSMFSLMNLLVLQPLPYPGKDHLVRIYRTTPQSQTSDHTAPDFTDLRTAAKDFADIAAFRTWGYVLAQADRTPVNLTALRVSANFFPAIGLQPELGRFFTQDEDAQGNHVMIIGHAIWQTQFGGDPTIIGRNVRIDGEPTTIVGVMPASFASVFLWGPGDAFRPLALLDVEKMDRNNAAFSIIGRYHSDLTLEQLNARLTTIATTLAQNRPSANSKDGLHAVTLQSLVQNKNVIQLMTLLLALAGFVLLIACANLANLQLARALARTREFGIRAALGASRRRLLGPLLAESILLALIGGAFGLLVAVWSNDWVSSRLSATGFVTFTVTMDWHVIAFALILSVFTGMIFGIVPAWLTSRVNVNETLKSGGRGSTGDRAHHRFRHFLIVGQFALALMLLVGAGLFIRSVNRMLARDTGWASHQIVQGIINLPAVRYPDPAQTYSFYTQLQERLKALPGAKQVTIGWTLPIFQYLANRNYVVEGREPPVAGHEPLAGVNAVMPSYLDTLKIKLLRGRNFSDDDKLRSNPVAMINESMAKTLFPNENPIGRRIGNLDPANRGWMEIVGVFADVEFAVGFGGATTKFTVLRPLAQETWTYVTVAILSDSPAALTQPLRETIAAMDSNLALQQEGTVDQFMTKVMSSTHMIDTLLVCFATLGLFLAAIGLYGVIARIVTQRTGEIGVRMALGAQPRDVMWLIMRLGIKLTVYGTVFGLIGSYLLARALAAMSPQAAGPSDFTSIIVATLVL
ncbi:MAG: ABC transporter permease, partial [Lacunisphaera sp.]